MAGLVHRFENVAAVGVIEHLRGYGMALEFLAHYFWEQIGNLARLFAWIDILNGAGDVIPAFTVKIEVKHIVDVDFEALMPIMLSLGAWFELLDLRLV